MLPWRRRATDPSYPSARWLGQRSPTGDLTGGTVFTQIELVQPNQRDSRLWTVDVFAARRLDGSADVVSITLSGFDTLVYGISPVIQWVQGLNQDAGLARAGMTFRTIPLTHLPPVYARAGVTLAVAATFGVNTNGVTYELFAAGWVWDATALDTPTGPQKPRGF